MLNATHIKLTNWTHGKNSIKNAKCEWKARIETVAGGGRVEGDVGGGRGVQCICHHVTARCCKCAFMVWWFTVTVINIRTASAHIIRDLCCADRNSCNSTCKIYAIINLTLPPHAATPTLNRDRPLQEAGREWDCLRQQNRSLSEPAKRFGHTNQFGATMQQMNSGHPVPHVRSSTL